MTRTNLFPIPQPVSGPWNASGWGTGGAGTQGPVAGVGYGGGTAHQMQYTTSPTAGGAGVRVGNTGLPAATAGRASVTPGATYTASGYVEVNAADTGWLARIIWYDSAGVSIAGTPEGTAVAVAANTPTRVNVTATAPGNAVSAQLHIRKNAAGGTPVGRRWRFSAPLLEAGPTLEPYFDGDTADTASLDYAWAGAPNASTSTATPITAPATWTFVDELGNKYTPIYWDGATEQPLTILEA